MAGIVNKSGIGVSRFFGRAVKPDIAETPAWMLYKLLDFDIDERNIHRSLTLFIAVGLVDRVLTPVDEGLPRKVLGSRGCELLGGFCNDVRPGDFFFAITKPTGHKFTTGIFFDTSGQKHLSAFSRRFRYGRGEIVELSYVVPLNNIG